MPDPTSPEPIIPASTAVEPAPTPDTSTVVVPAVETPVVVPEAVAPEPASVEPPAPEAPLSPPSLLEEAKANAPEPEAPAPTEPEAPAEEPPAVEPPAPTYETIKLPEGIEMPAEELGRFTEILGDNKIAPEIGQKLLDAYVAETQRSQTETLKNQHDVFNTTRAGWRDQFKADAEMGGNRQDTTIRNCAAVIEQYGGNAVQQAELRAMLTFTGGGDHPAMIRLLNNIGKVLGEPRPIAAAKPPEAPVSKAAKRYAGNAS